MSWEQFQAITERRREELEHERTRKPTACPNDGHPLMIGPEGKLRCPFDGWEPPGGNV